MNVLVRDLRYASRVLLKRPGVTIVIVLCLTLGIGANTAIFSVVDAVVLSPLPFEDPDQLVMLRPTEKGEDARAPGVSYPDFTDIREQNRAFEEVAIFHTTGSTLSGFDAPVRINGARVSAGFFPLLRVQPILGRLFSSEDDVPGAENVVILSNALWQHRFGSDRDVLGKVMRLDGVGFTIVGVLPEDFSFPVNLSEAELWTPTALDGDFQSDRMWYRNTLVARLKANATMVQAQADIDTISRHLERQYPDSNTGRGIRLAPLYEEVVSDVRSAAYVLFGAVGLVLLLACTNIANLLLAHSASRGKEFAVRAALGAGRGRLIRLLLTESVLQAVVGGMTGLLLALWGTDVLIAMMSDDVPRTGQIALDGRVLVFALLISIATGLGFGLVPALNASQSDPHSALKEGGRTSGGAGRHRLRNSLVVCEVALALVLLIGAGLMIRSFHRLTRVDSGFDADNVLTFQMSIPFSAYSDPTPRAGLYREVVQRIESLPGVESAGAATTLPLGGRAIILAFQIEGRPDPPPGEERLARSSSVTAGYFRTMGIALRSGRVFTQYDRRDTPGVAAINETMARQFWPNGDAIGQRITPSHRLGDDDPEIYEIVGVVADVRGRGLDREVRPTMYFPFEQHTWPFTHFALRTNSDPLRHVTAVRAEVADVVRDDAPFQFKTMEQYLVDSVGDRRFPMLLLSMFAAMALVLAATGIYAMFSYTVAQRTHEIGLRMAMGARRPDVLRLVLRHGVALTSTGLAIGLLASLALARVLSSQLYEIGAADPATFIGVSLVLGFVACLACYIPARRATKVDPIVALRCE